MTTLKEYWTEVKKLAPEAGDVNDHDVGWLYECLDNGVPADEVACELRRMAATGLADRRNGC